MTDIWYGFLNQLEHRIGPDYQIKAAKLPLRCAEHGIVPSLSCPPAHFGD